MVEKSYIFPFSVKLFFDFIPSALIHPLPKVPPACIARHSIELVWQRMPCNIVDENIGDSGKDVVEIRTRPAPACRLPMPNTDAHPENQGIRHGKHQTLVMILEHHNMVPFQNYRRSAPKIHAYSVDVIRHVTIDERAISESNVSQSSIDGHV